MADTARAYLFDPAYFRSLPGWQQLNPSMRACLRDILDEIWLSGDRGSIALSKLLANLADTPRTNILATIDLCTDHMGVILSQIQIDGGTLGVESEFLKRHFAEHEACIEYESRASQRSLEKIARLDEMTLLSKVAREHCRPSGVVRYLEPSLRVLSTFENWLPTPRFVSHGQILWITAEMIEHWSAKFPNANCRAVLSAIYHQWKMVPASRRGAGKIIGYVEQRLQESQFAVGDSDLAAGIDQLLDLQG